jgi:hypothetical protein
LKGSFLKNNFSKAFSLGLISVNCFAYSEREVIAATLVGEGGIDGKMGIIAVNEVIYHRSKLFGITPYQTVIKKKHFSSLNKGIGRAVERAKQHYLWEFALELTKNPPKTNFTKGATHFAGKDLHPYWAKKMELCATIGKHRFYR